MFPANVGTRAASVLNFTASQTTQNAVTVGLGSTLGFGEFDLCNGSPGYSQLIVDVYGYYND